jgi:8-amino-7-oxononanoate synthase
MQPDFYYMSQFDFIKEQLDELRQAGLLRSCRTIDSAQGPLVRMDGRQMLLFCSNNYLGLASHPAVAAAVARAVGTCGYGAAASRLISGTMSLHIELESALARFCRKEAALVFSSGWTANESLLTTLPQKGDLVLLDKLDHASIIDAARGSGADFRTYRRQSPSRIEKLLTEGTYQRRFIVTESVFSMDGDVADIKALVDLKKRHKAILIVDEAHAFGCMGPTGAGLAESLGLLSEVDILVATMSKAMGASGGIVAAPQPVIELLINKARPFIYTTAPSPVNCAAALASLAIIESEPARRQRLSDNSEYLRTKLKALGLNTGNSCTHIVPVIIGGEKETLAVSAELYRRGFFIPAIRPPTVAPGSSRLRISLQSEHNTEHLDSLCDAFAELIASGAMASPPRQSRRREPSASRRSK